MNTHTHTQRARDTDSKYYTTNYFCITRLRIKTLIQLLRVLIFIVKQISKGYCLNEMLFKSQRRPEIRCILFEWSMQYTYNRNSQLNSITGYLNDFFRNC